MTTRYGYAQRDLLVGAPEDYAYAPFDGLEFLIAYRRQRDDSAQRAWTVVASRRREEADGDTIPAILAWRGKRVVWSLTPENRKAGSGLSGEVQTVTLLQGFVTSILRPGEVWSPAMESWVSELARKFEVSKRIRSRYDGERKPVTRDSAPPRAYAYLAFLIAILLGGEPRLRLLNALLKLNDLLSSLPPERIDGVSAASMLVAVEREIEVVESLARQKGLQWPPRPVGENDAD